MNYHGIFFAGLLFCVWGIAYFGLDREGTGYQITVIIGTSLMIYGGITNMVVSAAKEVGSNIHVIVQVAKQVKEDQ